MLILKPLNYVENAGSRQISLRALIKGLEKILFSDGQEGVLSTTKRSIFRSREAL